MVNPTTSTFYSKLNLTGQTALVTGASGHLGRVICKSLAELGCSLVLVDINQERLSKQSLSLSNQYPITVYHHTCDLQDPTSRSNLQQDLAHSLSSLDILINNAAFVSSSPLDGWTCPFESQSLNTWDSAFSVNLSAPFHLSQLLLPLLSSSNAPSIINISSIYGFLGPDMSIYRDTSMGNPAAYSCSKAGLIQLTKWLSTVLAPNIRVNSVSIGGLYRDQDPNFVSRYIERTPLKRMGSEDDIVGAVIYLATQLSSWVTGHNLVVDGGWSTW